MPKKPSELKSKHRLLPVRRDPVWFAKDIAYTFHNGALLRSDLVAKRHLSLERLCSFGFSLGFMDSVLKRRCDKGQLYYIEDTQGNNIGCVARWENKWQSDKQIQKLFPMPTKRILTIPHRMLPFLDIKCGSSSQPMPQRNKDSK